MFIFAQIMGILANISIAISPQQKEKAKVILFQILASIFFAIQYFILEAYSGVAVTVISMINNLIFWNYSRKDKKIPFYWLLINIVINIVAGIFTYTNLLSIIPVVIAILLVYGIWQENLRINRVIILITSAGWIVYNVAISAYASSIANAIALISAIISVWRLDIKKTKLKNPGNKNI